MNMSISIRQSAVIGAAAAFSILASAAAAQETGLTDASIKIGLIQPFSGPASAYSQIAYTNEAYVKKINEEGGVCGRQIELVMYDDGYSPPKAVEQARKLVESDEVFLIFNALGTPSNSAIQKYMNAKKVPQLFVATGASKWAIPRTFRGPWAGSRTTSTRPRSTPTTSSRTIRTARSASSTRTTITGKDYIKGLRDALGDKASMIVAEQPYEVA